MAITSLKIPGVVMTLDAMQRNAAEWDKRGRSWQGFDRIEMTEKQAIEVVEKLFDSEYFSSTRLLNPSIPEFSAIIQEPGEAENTYLCFRKTLLQGDDFLDDSPDGLERILTPAIDAYAYCNNNGTLCNLVITLAKCELKANGHSNTFTAQFVSYWNPDPATDYMLDHQEELQEFMRTVKSVYLAVQMLSLERPEVFVARSAKIQQQETVRKKGRYKKVSKTKLIRVIRVSDEVLSAVESHNHRTITCPCWGVAGHWRTYKSGRRVWINPYRKGKQRANPAAYKPKVYQLPEEEAAYV